MNSDDVVAESSIGFREMERRLGAKLRPLSDIVAMAFGNSCNLERAAAKIMT